MDTDNRMWTRALHLRVSVFICGSLLGCAHQAGQRTIYRGPTEPMERVVRAINANNSKLPSLFASLSTFEASIVDERGRRDDANLGGQILYRSPRELRVVGTSAIGSVVELGSNNLVYWLIARDPGPDT